MMHALAKLLEGMFLVGLTGSAFVILFTIIDNIRVMLRVAATRVD